MKNDAGDTVTDDGDKQSSILERVCYWVTGHKKLLVGVGAVVGTAVAYGVYRSKGMSDESGLSADDGCCLGFHVLHDDVCTDNSVYGDITAEGGAAGCKSPIERTYFVKSFFRKLPEGQQRSAVKNTEMQRLGLGNIPMNRTLVCSHTRTRVSYR